MSSSIFSDTVNRIVLRVACEEGHESTPEKKKYATTVGGGPLTKEELSELSLLCSNAAASNDGAAETIEREQEASGFATVEAEQLLGLLELLDRHINTAVGVNFVLEALEVLDKAATKASVTLDAWLLGAGSVRLQMLHMGLEAASIILSIATSPGVDRRAINEDAIEAAIGLMRFHLRKNLVPALNQTGHLMKTSNTDTTVDPVLASPTKKRRRSSVDPTLAASQRALKKTYKYILSTVHLQIALMERLQQLVDNLPLDDAQILMLTSGVLPSFEIDSSICTNLIDGSSSSPPGQQLQLVSIAVCTAAFRRYPMHRDTMLEDLYPIMLQLPTGKRSLRTFPLRYSSTSHPDRLAALNGTVLGNLFVSGKDTSLAYSSSDPPRHIQMLSALILSLVQACVRRPTYQQEESNDSNGGDENLMDDKQQTMCWSSGLTDCQAVVEMFCAELLRRCSRIKGGGSTEFRPVLTHLVEDFLAVLLIPEFPAAEMLLSFLTTRLFQVLSLASSNVKGGTPPEATFMTVAFDALGKIFAVQARILALQKEKGLSLTTGTPMSDKSDSDIVMGCYCHSESSKDKLVVCCDQCKTWFHGKCVGISDRTVPPGDWLCDSCRLGQIFVREQNKYRGQGKMEDYIDDAYTFRQAFQGALAHRLGVVGMEDATKVHLARWMDELEQKGKAEGFALGPQKLINELLQFWGRPGPAGEILTGEGANRTILFLASKASPLLVSFRTQFRYLLQFMSDNSHSLRKLSLKTVEKTIEGDPGLMTLPIIVKSVSRRLSDDSISVREAAVSLVGSYVVRSPQVAKIFHTSLLACLEDSGISVRKRAIKIFQSILMSNPSYKGRANVCNIMLQLAADPKEEDAVRDMIESLFTDLWLKGGGDDIANPGTPDLTPALERDDDSPVVKTNGNQLQRFEQGIVTPTPPASRRQDRSLSMKRCDLAAEQMMEVVRSSQDSFHLEALLKKLLDPTASDADKGRKQNDRKKLQELNQNACRMIVSSLFELLIKIEEDRVSRGVRVGKDLAATLQTISVFAEVSPDTVFGNIDTILPYLKADNGVTTTEESLIVAAVSEIIFRLARTLGQQVVDRLSASTTAKDLVQITYRFGPLAFGPAIRAFSSLAHRSDSVFEKKLLELGRIFYTFLYKRVHISDFAKSEEKIRDNAHRALAVLGFICEHRFDTVDSSMWDEEVAAEETNLVLPQELEWDNVMLACFRLFTTFLQKIDTETKCKALRALGGIFASQPRLLLQLDQEGLIAELMSKNSSPALQLESIKCWCNILEAEENRIDGGHAKAKMDANTNITVSKRISGDQDGDATLFGGVLTNHAVQLFQMTRSPEMEIRLAVLECLGLLLRQGLVNPNDAVPHLFALQGDVENDAVRNLSLRLLMAEGEKRPDTLRRRVCAGVKHAYAFQRAVSRNAQVSATVMGRGGVECIFSSVFKECVANSRKQRHGFFKNLLGLFKVHPGSKKAESRVVDLSLLSFTTQILAHLDYRTLDDPLLIVHEITSIVALQGSETLDSFSDLLRTVGLASADAIDDNHDAEDALERAARGKFPSRTSEARPLSSKEFEFPRFLALCRDGMALCLLLRLKTFLRRTYNLSETRCLEYNPSDNERISDKGITKADVTKPLDASVPRVLLSKNGDSVDRDALIRNYAEFRRLMREESSLSLVLDSNGGDENDDEKNNAETPAAKRKTEDMGWKKKGHKLIGPIDRSPACS